MSDATPNSAAGEPPTPAGVASLDELVQQLRALRAWAGVPYRELHRRLVRRRRFHGVAEEPAYATVYRCLQPGRRRLDLDLVADIVAVLTGDEHEAARWREVSGQVHGEATTATSATVLKTLPDVEDFTGRDVELTALVDRAISTKAPTSPVLAIEGMAGVGKTTLAARAARGIVDQGRHTDMVLAVNLCGHDPERAPVEPMAVLDGFLRELGEPGQRIQAMTLAERSVRFRQLLAERPVLLLLDNAASADQIDRLLPENAAAPVLVTSRHRVVRHPTAHHLTLDVFTSEQALDLLRKHAGAAVDTAPDIAVRIVEQVGHLPLAVALVAARIQTSAGWTLEDHLDQLIERREALRLDPGVELAFTTSYEGLPPSLRRMLRLLSLHPGRDCDTYAAAALAGIDPNVARRQIAELIGASLVSSRHPGRYELHDLVRVFALSRARDDDPPSARRAAVTRLLDYYRWAAAKTTDVYAPSEQTRRRQVPDPGAATLPVPDRTAATAWLEIERPNLVAVGVHAAEHGWAEHVSDLSAILARYLRAAAHYDDAAQLHDHATRVTTGASQGVAQKNLAVARWHQGRRAEALDQLHEALKTARVVGDRANEARALSDLGIVYQHMGRYLDAIRALEQALETYGALDDPVGEGRALQNLGNTHRARRDHDQAFEVLERARVEARSAGDSEGEAFTMESLCRLLNQMGRHEEARQYALHTIVVARRTQERVALAEGLTGLGTACAGLGNHGMAVRYQRYALRIAAEFGGQASEIYGHIQLGITLRQTGALSESLAHHDRALKVAQDVGDLNSQASAHDELGQTYACSGDIPNARSCWAEARRIFVTLGSPKASEVQSRLDTLNAEYRPTRRGDS